MYTQTAKPSDYTSHDLLQIKKKIETGKHEVNLARSM